MTRRDNAQPAYLVFLRAINGGPANRIKMVDLVRLIEGAGFTDVGYHLQTGNVRVRPHVPMPADEIELRIDAALGAAGLRRTDAMARTPEQLRALIASAPFADVDPGTNRRCITFLRPAPASRLCDEFDRRGIRVAYVDDTVLCTVMPLDLEYKGGPTEIVERKWKVSGTSRWWHVVCDTVDKLAGELR